jgi:transcriptional regulator NrdR family protein
VARILRAMVAKCPSCGSKKTRVLDVKRAEKSNVIRRTHRCLDCRRIIGTEERVVNPDRTSYSIR